MLIWRNKQTKRRHLKCTKPVCTHNHLREGEVCAKCAPLSAERFQAEVEMPNLESGPITTRERRRSYRGEIMGHIKSGVRFDPWIATYLTDGLVAREMEIYGDEDKSILKYYPRGGTTNSENGVVDPTHLWTPGRPAFESLRATQQNGGVAIFHAADVFTRRAVTINGRAYDAGEELDPYDQEAHFFLETLPYVMDAHPFLKKEMAHLSSKLGADFMRKHGGDHLGCSLTGHHLSRTRRDGMRGGFRPHLDWRPVIQSHDHLPHLRDLATSGLPFVWLGKDSAPHPRSKKEAACCATGVVTAHIGFEMYVEIFDECGALAQLEDFSSTNAARFYGVELSEDTIELEEKPWRVKDIMRAQVVIDGEQREDEIVPFRLGEEIGWQIVQAA